MGGPGRVNAGHTRLYKFRINDPGADGAAFVSTFPRCGKSARLVEARIGPNGGHFRCRFTVNSPRRTAVTLGVRDSDGAVSRTARRGVIVNKANRGAGCNGFYFARNSTGPF